MSWNWQARGERRWTGHGYVITQSTEKAFFNVSCGVRNVGGAPSLEQAQHLAATDYAKIINEARVAKRDGLRQRRTLNPSE
jgi:hypothetical protein